MNLIDRMTSRRRSVGRQGKDELTKEDKKARSEAWQAEGIQISH